MILDNVLTQLKTRSAVFCKIRRWKQKGIIRHNPRRWTGQQSRFKDDLRHLLQFPSKSRQ